MDSRQIGPSELRELADQGCLYAVLDACDTPAVSQKAGELGMERAVSLYRGSADEMYWAIAPYLFAVDAELLDWITATLWGGPWGIFAVADTGLEELRKHFRRFLLVHSPEGEQLYFRFYDPRVLAGFLPLCTGAEAMELFGPVTHYGIPSQDAPAVTLIQRPTAAQRLRIRRVERPPPSDQERA
jgi:hypothetical protein